MTIDELRKYPQCEHYSDEQARNILQTLENLAVFLFEFTCRKNGMVIDNQLFVKEIEKENDLNIAA